MNLTDYLYCRDCDEYVDLWKHGSVEDAGHSKHGWRYVNEEEMRECVKECEEEGCFEEERP